MRCTPALLLICATQLAAPAALAADLIGPSVFASIEDNVPFSGAGDAFKAPAFNSIVIRSSSVESRVIRELDVTSLAGATIQTARLTGVVSVNNALDTGLRTFDFVVYDADGVASLTDYQLPGTLVGTGAYHPPAELSFDFDFDVASELQTLLDGGATHIGLRVAPTSSPSAANSAGSVLLTVTATGAPPTGDWTQQTGRYQLASPSIGDVDGDGWDEVVLVTASALGTGSPQLHVWRHDGTSLAGFPIDLTSGSLVPAALADLDGDGKLELLIAGSTLDVFDHTGTAVPGWGHSLGVRDLSVGDIDGDGRPEVVVARTSSSAISYEHDGTYKVDYSIPSFPFFQWESAPALADLDGDGDLEVIGRGTDSVAIWHGDGSLTAGSPVAVPGGTTARPVVADLDGDGSLELVITADTYVPFQPGLDLMYVLSSTGTVLPGWPQSVAMSIHDQPSVADLDGDGDLEVVLTGGSSGGAPQVFALHHTGVAVAGFPVVPQSGVPAIGRSAVTFGDVDGDELPELLLQVGNAIFAIDGDGSDLPGFPFVLPAAVSSATSSPAPVLADLDKDGLAELVATASSDLTKVQQLDVPFSADVAPWSQDDGDARGTSWYRPAALTAASHSVPAGGAATIAFALELGPQQAGALYFLLAGASGTAPGLALPGGPGSLPLNIDAVSVFALGAAGGPLLPGFVGVLDQAGRASASLVAPSGLFAGLAGARIDFAAVLGASFGAATNPVGVWVTP
ncbi:MAG: VCBS repeat-containing protein [Planctomycetota bacterium]|nr:VCBS repeat-containing protein [Planctomycetota bacterium]